MSDVILLEQFRDKQVRVIRNIPNRAEMPINDIADAIDYDRKALRNMVHRNNDIFGMFTGRVIMTSPSGSQETMTLTRDGVIGLLVKLDHKRVKDPAKRQLIIDFQIWAIETLGRVMDNEIPRPEFQPWADDVGEHLKLGKLLSETTGVKQGIAFAAAMYEAQKETGRDLSTYMKLLPPAEHETAHLTPSDLGKRLGMSAVKLNKELAALGFIQQHQDQKGHKYWRITDQGKGFGEEYPFVRNGHSGYQIKWREDIVSHLNRTGTDN